MIGLDLPFKSFEKLHFHSEFKIKSVYMETKPSSSEHSRSDKQRLLNDLNGEIISLLSQ